MVAGLLNPKVPNQTCHVDPAIDDLNVKNDFKGVTAGQSLCACQPLIKVESGIAFCTNRVTVLQISGYDK